MHTFTKADWAYTPEGIVVFCETEQDAKRRLKHDYQHWTELAERWGVCRAWLKYPGCKRNGIEVLAPMAVITTESLDDVHTVYQSLKLTTVDRQLHQIMGRMIESDRPMFLLANDNDDQLWLNQLACDMIELAGEVAVQRCIKDYWEANDWQRLHQKLRDTSQPFEHDYRAVLNDLSNPIWFKAVSRYEPVEIGGRSFRLSINQHFEIIGQSQLVTAS